MYIVSVINVATIEWNDVYTLTDMLMLSMDVCVQHTVVYDMGTHVQ